MSTPLRCRRAAPNPPGIERLRDLRADSTHLFEKKRAACEAFFERLSVDQFHHDNLLRVERFDAVDCGDVGMIHRCENMRRMAATSLKSPCTLLRKRKDQDRGCAGVLIDPERRGRA